MAELNNVLNIIRSEKGLELNNLFSKFRDINPCLAYEGKVTNMIRDICETLEIDLGIGRDSKDLIDSFRVIYRNTWKFKVPEEFKKIIIAWISLNQLPYLPAARSKKHYLDFLRKKKSYYDKAAISSSPSDKTILNSASTQIKEKIILLNKMYYFETPILIFRQDLTDAEKENLQEIFDFYANSHLIISKFTTFDGLKVQKRLWSCGVFVKFCTVFGLYGKLSSKKQLLSHKTILEIFTKHSILKKNMNFQGFFNSLQDVTSELLKIPGKFRFPVDFQGLESGQYRIILCDRIKLMMILNIREKMRKSVKSFACGDVKSRISPDDPCLSYKFLPSPQEQNKLRELKFKKSVATQRRTVVPHSEPTPKVKSRPLSSFQSLANFRKTGDVVRVYHSKSKASLTEFKNEM
jgi:hypothetical protein